MLYKNTVDAVVGAWQNRKDGVLFGGSVEVEGILNDSRDPQVYSKTLFRFRFEPYDNSRGLQMIHFGAHPPFVPRTHWSVPIFRLIWENALWK